MVGGEAENAATQAVRQGLQTLLNAEQSGEVVSIEGLAFEDRSQLRVVGDLEDHDDVQTVFSDVELSDAVLQELEADG